MLSRWRAAAARRRGNAWARTSRQDRARVARRAAPSSPGRSAAVPRNPQYSGRAPRASSSAEAGGWPSRSGASRTIPTRVRCRRRLMERSACGLRSRADRGCSARAASRYDPALPWQNTTEESEVQFVLAFDGDKLAAKILDHNSPAKASLPPHLFQAAFMAVFDPGPRKRPKPDHATSRRLRIRRRSRGMVFVGTSAAPSQPVIEDYRRLCRTRSP